MSAACYGLPWLRIVLLASTTPPWLTALGRRSLPLEIEVEGQCYTRRRVFKNDFFAVTALYESDREKVILKVGRRASLLLLPMGWIGRILAAREQAAMHRLAGIEGIPRFIGRWEKTGIVRVFLEGEPLKRGMAVPDDFFPRLAALVEAIHQRGMAYVDLEKPENVLLGSDGRPYLFDFQISWLLPRRLGGELWPARVVRGWLQAGDRYHVRKQQRRIRPDQLTEEQRAASYERPWYLRAHGIVTRPLTWARRRFLDRVDPRRNSGERGRVA